MKLFRAVGLVLIVAATPLALHACADDDGADTREAGTVVIIGPPPPGGGGSVSAVGTGCVTKGATTKVPVADVVFSLDEHVITPPEQIEAGVNRLIVKNFGSEPHELIITSAASADELPVVDGVVDLEALPDKVFRVEEFAGNTICYGTFELPAGDYVAFSNVIGTSGSDYEQGMVTAFTVS